VHERVTAGANLLRERGVLLTMWGVDPFMNRVHIRASDLTAETRVLLEREFGAELVLVEQSDGFYGFSVLPAASSTPD
jgi:hypothetical protein